MITTTMKRLLAAGLVAGAVVAGGAVASAATSDTATSPAATAAAAVRRPARAALRFERRIVHGDLVVRTKDGFKDVTVDRGKLASVDGSTVTVDRADTGAAVTVTVTSTTRFRGVTGADQLVVGKPTIVVAAKDGSAVLIAQRRAGRAGAAAPSGNS